MRASLRELLQAAGYRVTEASNGHQALSVLHRGPLPHVIVLDIEMPTMDGVDFRLQQRRHPDLAAVPVIIYSSAPHTAALADALQASAYLRKSVDVQVILDTVREVIEAGRR